MSQLKTEGISKDKAHKINVLISHLEKKVENLTKRVTKLETQLKQNSQSSTRRFPLDISRKSVQTSIEITETDKTKDPPISIEDQVWLKKVGILIQQRIGNTNFSIAQLANDMALSERQFRRRMKALTEHTPSQYLKAIRLDQARLFLERRKFKAISQVAYAVGYKDPGSFTKAFRKVYGQNPSAYTSS